VQVERLADPALDGAVLDAAEEHVVVRGHGEDDRPFADRGRERHEEGLAVHARHHHVDDDDGVVVLRDELERGEVVQLTPTESRLLYALAANLGNTVSTETLLDRGWGDDDDADPSYVWVTMRRLRQKVEVDPNHPVHVQTMRGIGYRLVQVTDDGTAPADVDARAPLEASDA